MNEPERITLTQRRKEMSSNNRSGAAKLQRSKLERISDDMDDERTSGAKSTVAWMIIIIAVSVAAYFGVNNYLDSQNDVVNEDTTVAEIIPTSTPSLQDKIVSDDVLEDTIAINKQSAEAYTLDKQKIGEESEDAFTIESVSVQPYTTFIRYEIEIASEVTSTEDGTESENKNSIPAVEVIYTDSAITLNITNINTDHSLFKYDTTLSINDSIIKSILHSVAEGTNEAYLVTLQEEKPFVLHAIEGEVGKNSKIILDILELPRQEEVTPTEVVAEEKTEEEDTEINTDTESTTNNTGSASTSFSKGKQSLNTGTTGNVSTILGYAFDDHGEENPYVFRYEFKISGDYPNVEASLDESILTITIKNLARDNITGNGGDGHRDDFYGARDIKELNVKNRDNVSVYTFELTKPLEYRLVTHDADNRIYLEIKH